VNGPEGAAVHSAVHDPDAPGPQVRAAHARARSTYNPDPATDGPATERRAENPVRTALQIATERWGLPIGSPVTTSQPEQDSEAGRQPEVHRDPMAALRIWTEPSPPMSAILADLREGARLQAAHGWAWVIPYWLFGLPAFAVACTARLLLDSSARTGRFAALLAALSLVAVGLHLAGVI
jgi:hypothetical protein